MSYATKLQAVLAISSSGASYSTPHHPITCDNDARLWLEEDGSLRCPHTVVPPDDPRTIACINHSIALLIMELSASL